MKLQITHTTDNRLEGATFEVDDPLSPGEILELSCGTVLLDMNVIHFKGREYIYYNPNYVARVREVG